MGGIVEESAICRRRKKNFYEQYEIQIETSKIENISQGRQKRKEGGRENM